MRSKIIATVLAPAAAVLALGGCQKSQPAKAPVPTAVTAVNAPSLWRIEALNDDKVVRTVEICADQAVRAGFNRPAPEWRGQACTRVGEPKQTGAAYFVRCRFGDKIYVVSSSQKGDAARDFTVDMSVTQQDGKGPSFEQTRHYIKVGACPAGWKIGDSAALGDKQVQNTLSPSPAADQRKVQ
jgi:hypothetical protein